VMLCRVVTVVDLKSEDNGEIDCQSIF